MPKTKKEQIEEIIKEYSKQEYFWSEESGKEPDINTFVRQILSLLSEKIVKRLEKEKKDVLNAPSESKILYGQGFNEAIDIAIKIMRE